MGKHEVVLLFHNSGLNGIAFDVFVRKDLKKQNPNYSSVSKYGKMVTRRTTCSHKRRWDERKRKR